VGQFAHALDLCKIKTLAVAAQHGIRETVRAELDVAKAGALHELE